MSKELKKLKGGKDLAYKVANHPNFLKLGKRGLKKLVKKIAKNSIEIKEEINEIRNMLVSFIVISIFLTIGFIYCIMSL